MVLQTMNGSQVARRYCPAFQAKAFDEIRWLPKASEETWAALDDIKGSVPSPETWKTMTLGEQDKVLQTMLRDLQRSLYGKESAEGEHSLDVPVNALHSENAKVREIDLTAPGHQNGGHRGGRNRHHGRRGGFRF